MVGRRRPVEYFEGKLRAIVGVELHQRIEAKFKLSQNRPAADVDGVIDGLLAGPAIGNPMAAAAMDAVRRRTLMGDRADADRRTSVQVRHGPPARLDPSRKRRRMRLGRWRVAKR